MTKLWAGRPRNRGLTPGRRKTFISTAKCPNWLCDPASLLSSRYSARFLREQNGRGLKLTARLHQMPSLCMGGQAPPLPNMPQWPTSGRLYFYLDLVSNACSTKQTAKNFPHMASMFSETVILWCLSWAVTYNTGSVDELPVDKTTTDRPCQKFLVEEFKRFYSTPNKILPPGESLKFSSLC
jgi:hypothetical protein